ncbi:MAG: hypothetical protein WC460_04710 [Patescibacteria group bacterium]
MFLTVHGAIGIIIGQRIQNPIFAFFLGLIAHYIFDAIPHGDSRTPQNWKGMMFLISAAAIDILTLGSLLLIFYQRIEFLKPSVYWAFFGSLLPDFFQAIYLTSNKKFLKLHQKLHNFFHFLIAKKYEWKFTTGLILQIIFFIILLTFIV